MGVNKWDEYSDEELIQIIKDFKTNNKITIKEVRKNDNLPNVKYLLKRFGTATWNEFLLICGIETNKVWKKDKNEGLEYLIFLYKSNNQIPTASYLKNTPETKFKYTWYINNFGTFENALLEAGIIKNKKLNEAERIQESFNEITKLAKELKRFPCIKEYNKNRKNGYEVSVLVNKLNLSYNEICKKYFPEYNVNLSKNITREDIINGIIKIKNKIGKVPMMNELQMNGFEYNSSTIYRVCKTTYPKLLLELGLESNGWVGIRKTQDELLEDFYKLFKELKRVPTAKDMSNCKHISTRQIYISRFGSIKNICNLLGIDFSLYYKGNGLGYICFDKNGDVCRSLMEKYITDLLIDNNIVYEKESLYSELINWDNKRRFDWKITLNDKVYYIEYAGLYNIKGKSNISKLYNKKIRKKVKDLYKANHIKNCLFIFPYDIDTNNTLNKISTFLSINMNDIKFETPTNYKLLSDQELFKEVEKYMCDNYLPTLEFMKKGSRKYLYMEILNRYDDYVKFAEAHNKLLKCKNRNYWNKDRVFDVFEYMVEQYKEIIGLKKIDKLYSLDVKLKGFSSAFTGKNKIDSFNNLRLEYLQNRIKNNLQIPYNEFKWLESISLNVGTGIKNKFTNEQVYEVNILINKLDILKQTN